MFDTIIIGAGPAGMSAALYLLREGKKVLLIEKETIGGQIAESPRLENYPSIKSISGMDFASNLFDQISSLGVEFDLDEVIAVNKLEERHFKVKTNYNEYESKSIIIATGCKHRKLGLPNEEKLTGKGVSYCAVCDGAFYQGKDVCLIGDANTAVQYAISLSSICKSVTIVTLFDKFFADEILISKLKTLQNVKIYHDFASKELIGEHNLEGVKFVNTKTNQEMVINCEGLFVAIGQIPDNNRFSSLVDLQNGFIVTDESKQTKTPGVYAVGDCTVKRIRQVVTATSDGALAAIACEKYIDSLEKPNSPRIPLA
ncbi:MAG: FAD-dependent oxidoreductase [Candidatus Enteromonas sp.]|nr:FAD-dependent oxidoreductase [Mollicutes bacterium]MDD7715264.1 FAD-dependent oxidoreductase [Mollicutes bacterium]MDY4935437.1 FAD-dependent oxidoreductase [Candidatus Enteromonas sp.]